jgi:hypothetical protein
MTTFLIEHNDGSVTIMQTAEGATAEACIAKWPEGLSSTVIGISALKPSDIPQNKMFRGAWVKAGDGIGVDMVKARGIHRDWMRSVRKPKLAALDTAYQQADERGDSEAKSVIAAEKQALRDVTKDPAIDAAETPAELAAAIPDVLKG